MEPKNISVFEHDNKENIPPFSTSKKPGPNEEKGKCALMKKTTKGTRRPLSDVTNSYRGAGLRGFDSRVQSPVLVSVFTSPRPEGKKMKGIRRPLRDVTIFYRGAELDSRVQSPVLASVFSSSKKRKLVEEDDEEQRNCSKILRRQYR
ncbi:hypothetical protein AAHA92_10819 [Salvia divinorum]|uniref:Uncharacterized protein n=1 Tax=Salvia divinorum TaxID=28513 RepID=A0ABD1HVW6_SALDI